MNSEEDEQTDVDATEDQLAELRKLGIADADLVGLTASGAEEWIDELLTERRDADKFGLPGREGAP